MGRKAWPKTKKAINVGMCGYPSEVRAIKAFAKARKFKTAFDFVRSAIIAQKHPELEGKVQPPKMHRSVRESAA